ncbi:MAG TPA: hypothetical protein VI669_13500, partial [Vicinamibacteria bacterium]
MVPSVVQLLQRTALIDRVGAWPALERNEALADPAFVPGFKTALISEPLRPLARLGRNVVTA